MEKITSFEVNHDKLKEGFYLSRIDGKDGDIITYDLRITVPNTPPYLENAGVHTFEHLFATYVRNCAFKEHIIYFGPMGCLTGFYFIVQNLENVKALEITKDALKFISGFKGEIPGSKKIECGNYKMHNLKKAKEYADKMIGVLALWNDGKLRY